MEHLCTTIGKPRPSEFIVCSLIKTKVDYRSSCKPLIINIADHEDELNEAILLFEITRYYYTTIDPHLTWEMADQKAKHSIYQRNNKYTSLLSTYEGSHKDHGEDEIVDHYHIPHTNTSITWYYSYAYNSRFKKLYELYRIDYNYQNPYSSKNDTLSSFLDQKIYIDKFLGYIHTIWSLIGEWCKLPSGRIDCFLIATNKTFLWVSLPLTICTRVVHKTMIPFVVVEELMHYMFAYSQSDFQSLWATIIQKHPWVINHSNFHHFLIYHVLLWICDQEREYFHEQKEIITNKAYKEWFLPLLNQYSNTKIQG